MKTTIIKFIILSLFIFIITSCSFSPIILGENDENISGSNPNSGSNTTPGNSINLYSLIETSEDSITIQWDTPEGATPSSYRFYYKNFPYGSWNFISELSSSSALEITVNFDSLGSTSNYLVFGVSAVYTDGESIVHSSLDSTATPDSGWYILKK